MDTTNSSENKHRRVEDRKQDAMINWEAPGAPAVPVHSEGAALPADLQQLKALALAATPGPWERSARPNGPFWHISSGHTVGGKPCLNGRQAIGSAHAASMKDAPEYAAMFQANADFIAAANPAVVLDLIARIERATAPHAAQLGLTDARESLERARVYPGFGNLPQPLRVEIDNAATILAKLDVAPHGSAAPTEAALVTGGTAEQQARYAIDGAIQYGRENRNPPPSTDHWLYEYWNIGRQLATLGATGWDNVTPIPQRAAAPVSGDTPRVDALMAKWDDDGATRGSAFIELRDLARELERRAAVSASQAAPTVEDALREHLARVFDAMPANETLRGDQIAGQIRAGMMARIPVASQAAPVGGDDVLDIETVNCPECGARWGKIRAAVAAAKVPTVEQVADVVERLIGNVVLDWFGGRINGHDEPFSSDAHERAYLCEMIRQHGRIGEVSCAPFEPESVPIPTTVNMARMMLALGHSWLKENAPEHLAAPVEQGQGAKPSNSGELGAAPSEKAAALAVSTSVLPCPFCGNADEVYGAGNGLGTYCDNCGADGPSYEHDGKPVATWNDRAAPVGAGVVPDHRIYAVIDSMGWDLDDTEKDDMHRLCLAVLAAATARPVAADDQVRDQALEEAAMACEAWGNEKVAKWSAMAGDDEDARSMVEDAKARAWDALQCAAVIRALSRTTAHGGAQGERDA